MESDEIAYIIAFGLTVCNIRIYGYWISDPLQRD